MLQLTQQFPGVGDTDFACNQLGRDYQAACHAADAEPELPPRRRA